MYRPTHRLDTDACIATNRCNSCLLHTVQARSFDLGKLLRSNDLFNGYRKSNGRIRSRKTVPAKHGKYSACPFSGSHCFADYFASAAWAAANRAIGTRNGLQET
jgi:hypothetical protein